MKQVLILRGPSGSGKSTYARTLPDATIVSADDFFEKNGEYQWEPTLLSRAHQTCFSNFLNAIENGKELIVVDNTNVYSWEYSHYMRVARLAGYAVSIHSFFPKTLEEIKQCVRRSVHKVPSATICKACIEYEPNPSGWQCE